MTSTFQDVEKVPGLSMKRHTCSVTHFKILIKEPVSLDPGDLYFHISYRYKLAAKTMSRLSNLIASENLFSNSVFPIFFEACTI